MGSAGLGNKGLDINAVTLSNLLATAYIVGLCWKSLTNMNFKKSVR